MQWIEANWQSVLLIITGTMALASQIAALTPTTKDDEAISYLGKLFRILAGNYGFQK